MRKAVKVRYTKLDEDGQGGELNGEVEMYHQLLENGDRTQFGEDLVDSEDEEEGGKTFTVEQAVEAIGFGRFQIRLFIITALFSVADALEMMLLAVLSPVLRCEWDLSQAQVALITTVVFVGMGLMAPLWGFLGDQYGRKPLLFLVSIWIAYFGVLTTFSPRYIWMLILRGLVGGGMGGTPQGFALMTEYLPNKYRAKVLIFGTISWASGTMFEISLASIVIPTLGWRWLLALSSLPAIIILILFRYMPESARYLVAAGKKSEALVVLKRIAKINKSKLPEGELVQEKAAVRGHPRDLLSSEYRRTTITMWLLWFTTALSYYGMVLASAEILQLKNKSTCKCNLLTRDDYVSMVVSTVGEFTSMPFNMYLIDKIGRRYTGALNFFLCGIFFLLIQLHLKLAVLTAFMFVVRSMSTGMFNFIYIYTSEVYPTSVRTLGIGTASAWARVGAMLTPFLAQVLLDKSLSAAMWVYGGICIIGGLAAISLPIETLGRALPQMVSFPSKM